MSPPGAYLLGEAGLDQQQLRDWHRDRVQALQDGGVSFIAIETIPVSRYGKYNTALQHSHYAIMYRIRICSKLNTQSLEI